MITHLVMFKLKPGITREDPRVAALVGMMRELPKRIPEIREWEVGFNETEDPKAWDFGVRSRFSDLADLHAYFDHPAHLPVVEAWDQVAELAFVDFPG